MTKSRRRPTRRSAKPKTKARTKTTRRKTLRKPTGKTIQTRGENVVHLKPLYEEISLKIRELEALPGSERVKFAIARLSQVRAEFGEMCGPTMDIPADGMPIG